MIPLWGGELPSFRGMAHQDADQNQRQSNKGHFTLTRLGPYRGIAHQSALAYSDFHHHIRLNARLPHD